MVKRVCIYIDGANFYGGLTSLNKNFSDLNFDFENYIKYLCKQENVVRIYYYNALVKKKINVKIWEKQNKLFDRLHKLDKFWVKLCTRKSRLNILGEEYYTIKGDDIYLALDMIEDCYNNKFDKAILMSGDGDFTELLKRVKKKVKEVEVCYFKDCSSKVLLNQANKTHLINRKITNRFFFRERKRNKYALD
ncbi:MAG: NYN domain-containing protein [Nanoarchaeota archaeon]|nr:NYN domain-containing protein [Nanoarchaeota archaeon]